MRGATGDIPSIGVISPLLMDQCWTAVAGACTQGLAHRCSIAPLQIAVQNTGASCGSCSDY